MTTTHGCLSWTVEETGPVRSRAELILPFTGSAGDEPSIPHRNPLSAPPGRDPKDRQLNPNANRSRYIEALRKPAAIRHCAIDYFSRLSVVQGLQKFFQRIGLGQVHPAIRRGLVAVVGITIVLLGLVLVFLPGPGALVILIGLAVLGTEFVWARRIIRRARELGSQGKDYVKSLVTKP
ncbi:MAG TPA: PGPGW domain-containing protein [Chthoniobacterales bacterium]|jgi:hypothetical protein